MGTNFKKAPLSTYSIHRVKEALGGYNYYGYVHPTGQVIIMRETITTGDIGYADGRFSLANAWAAKATLAYKARSKI